MPGRRRRVCPRIAVTAIGEGLRAMHDALPAGRCPFSWSTGLTPTASLPDPDRTRYYRLLWDLGP